jgi:hypothetical protein
MAMTLLRKLLGSLTFAISCVACSGGSSNGTGAQPSGVSFRRDVEPIFAGTCTHCHHEGSILVDLTHPFDPATGIVGRPNNVANSFLIDKVGRADLDPHIEGSPMPWNIEPLTADEIANLRQWITDGAKDDDLYQTSIVFIFGDGMNVGRRGGKCGYCHYPGTPQPPDLTHPFDATVGIVDVTALRAPGKRVVPGNPDDSVLVKKVEAQSVTAALGAPMPLHSSSLSQAQVDTLKAWIAAGARND